MLKWFEELINGHQELVIVAFLGVILIAHFIPQKRDYMFAVLMAMCASLVIVAFVAEIFIPDNGIRFGQLATLLIVYGIAMYIILCDVLMLGLARYLTNKRGEKWVKEMDYPYLFLGAAGILMSASRLEIVTDRFSRIDILGPLVVTSAVVIRFVKTRAEIAGWNKPEK
jgi:hypothetical protein